MNPEQAWKAELLNRCPFFWIFIIVKQKQCELCLEVVLTLSDTGLDIFILLNLLDQILSADFSFNFQTFLEVKIDINRVILTPCQAH